MSDLSAYGHVIRLRTVQTVWAAVTRTPCATGAELACAAGLSRSSIYTALRVLYDAGFVEPNSGPHIPRQINLPFVEVYR